MVKKKQAQVGWGGAQKKFKKGINIFSKKGFVSGGTMLPKGGPNYAHPPKKALLRPWRAKESRTQVCN